MFDQCHYLLTLISVLHDQYSVTEVWSVPYVGTVVNGIVNCGIVKTGEAVLLGPDSNGHYQSTVVKSMQRKRFVSLYCFSTQCPYISRSRANVTMAEAGQCVSLALKRVRRGAVRKGMIIVHKSDTPPRGEHFFSLQNAG